jgi:hypothetical protein
LAGRKKQEAATAIRRLRFSDGNWLLAVAGVYVAAKLGLADC